MFVARTFWVKIVYLVFEIYYKILQSEKYLLCEGKYSKLSLTHFTWCLIPTSSILNKWHPLLKWENDFQLI